MSEKKKNIIIAIVALVIVVALVMIPVIMEKAKTESGDGASILSGSVQKGSVAKTLSGTGTLTAEEAEEIKVPEGVEVTKYLVSNSTVVKKGDPLALVNRNTVQAAIYSVWETMKEIESDMADAYGDDVSANLTDKTGLETTGEYEVLADKHREYEEIAEKLAQMYLDGYIKAPCDGMVSGIDEDAAAKLMSAPVELEFRAVLLGGNQQSEVLLLSEGDSEPSHDPSVTEYLYGMVTVTNDNGVMTWSPMNLVTAKGVPLTVGPEEPMAANLMTSMARLKNKELVNNDQFTVLVAYTYEDETAMEGTVTQVEPVLYIGTKSGGGGGGGGGTGGGGTGGMTAMVITTEEEDLYSLAQTTLMSVTPLDEMTISITVDELDILSVSLGDEAVVTVDALPGMSFGGVVSKINRTASNNGGNTKYSAEITLKRDEKMLDGMNASSLITVELKESVLLLPVKAISEDNGKSMVYLGYDEQNGVLTDPVEVQTGMSDGENAEILSGLGEGQTFWYSYYDKKEEPAFSSGNASFSFGRPGGMI